MSNRVIDTLRAECTQPPVVYCIDNHQVLASRRATTLALRHRRHWLGSATVHALDAFPEPGVVGWRDVTDDFIARSTDGDRVKYGIILANGEVRYW